MWSSVGSNCSLHSPCLHFLDSEQNNNTTFLKGLIESKGSAQAWLGGEAMGVIAALKPGSSPALRPGPLCADWGLGKQIGAA